MGIPETIVTIGGLMEKLLAKNRDRETAKLVSAIQTHQHELEKTISQERASHAKEIQELRTEHANEIAELRKANKYEKAEIEGGCAGKIDSLSLEHSAAIAAKDKELAALQSTNAALTHELNKIKALQKVWSRKPRPPLGEFDKYH